MGGSDRLEIGCDFNAREGKNEERREVTLT